VVMREVSMPRPTTNKMPLSEIVAACRDEHPDWTDVAIRNAAKRLHREMDSMDRRWRRQQRRFRGSESLAGLRPGRQ
jgi:ribosomal protein L44E